MVRPYDFADEKRLGGISMITIKVNGDVDVDDIAVFERSTGARQPMSEA